MLIVIKTLFFISFFIIFWANIGYPISIFILGKMFSFKKNLKDFKLKPTVTVMVVAHNEEDVILKKLENLKAIKYPRDKIKFLVSSDNSSDATNEIVEKFIQNNSEMHLKLYKVKKRMGKTNAQNEAQKIVDTEFLVMTDANSLLSPDSIKELMASFTSNDISYVTGRLSYINKDISETSHSESSYWNIDLKIREIESRMQTITAGNGALYACRNSDYYDFDPIKSHDSSMPIYYSLSGKRAIANHDAVAYEKAGENVEDEFNRKVRMNRVLLNHIIPSIKLLNVFKYKWFTYFYLGHRTCRYLLWIAHLILFLSNTVLSFFSTFYMVVYLFQIAFWGIAVLKQLMNIKGRLFTIIHYYATTIIAQWKGIIQIVTGKAKPFWEKAESTR